LPESSTEKPNPIEALSVHARVLRETKGEAVQSRLHEEVCRRRQAEANAHELREFVIKHSVFRIHYIVVFAMVVIGIALFQPAGVDVERDALAAFIAIASLVIAASTRSIGRAVPQNRICLSRSVKATPVKAGDSLAVDAIT
jgi:hypothetical protein